MAGKYHSTPKIRVAIVGLGAVGSALARGLAATGQVQLMLVGKGRPQERKVVRELGAAYIASLVFITDPIDIIVLALPERQLVAVSRQIGKLMLQWPKLSVLHTSGPTPAAVLESVAELGAGIAAWHPYQTFPRRGRSATLSGITYGVSGNRQGIAAARRLTRLLGGRAVVLKDADRLLYHASAVLACGFVAADLQAAAEVLKSIGLTDRRALDTVLPIAEATLRNIRELGLEAAQTGPAVRGDMRIIRKHVTALRKLDPGLARLYREQSRQIRKRKGTGTKGR